MLDFFLALGSIYGASGMLLKVILGMYAAYSNHNEQLSSNNPHEVDPELTGMMINVFAFTLVGIGFILLLLSTVLSTNQDPLLVFFTAIFQNVIMWLTSYSLVAVDKGGHTKLTTKDETLLIIAVFLLVPMVMVIEFFVGSNSISEMLFSPLLLVFPELTGLSALYYLRKIQRVPYQPTITRIVFAQLAAAFILIISGFISGLAI